ncbi:MAG: Na(+)/H(+) antiporter subunit B [Gemmatimonadota bacterium]
MQKQPIPRIATKILIPQIMIFGLYVHFHGDFGPGGGFQAGVILAGAIILYALIFGLKEAQRVLPIWAVVGCSAMGVLIYAGTGVAGLLLGGEFLNYNVLAHDPIHGQHRGILWVELGVLITVFGVMVGLFYAFAGRGRRRA